MGTLDQLQDTDGDAPADAMQPPAPEGSPGDQDAAAPDAPDGGDPKAMIGYIDPRLPAKVRVFLKACAAIMIDDPDAAKRFRAILASTNDHTKALAQYLEKTIQTVETRLGPLSDQEHDQVAVFLAGWEVSSLQHMGMPGLDDAGGRHDLIGRILEQVDAMTQGPAQGGDQPPAPGAPPPDAPAPPGAAPPGGGGTLPQLGA